MVNHRNESRGRGAHRTPRLVRLHRHLPGRRTHAVVVMALIAATVSSWAGAGKAAANPLCAIAGPLSQVVCDAAGSAASAAASSAVGGTFEKIVNSLLEGYQTVLTWALAWWIKLPSPQLDNKSSLMQEVHDHTLQIQVVGLTFSLMFFGLRMMIDRKRSLADDAEEGFKLIFRSAMATAAIPLALTVGGRIADGISTWLVSESVTAGGDGDVIKNFLKLDLLTNSALGTAAIGIIALVGLLGAFLQLALLVVREAMLLLVVAALPVAAAFSGTGPGSQSYQRLVAWSVAFLLFKPVGALTYFVAFRAGASKDNAQQVVLGMVLMLLCAFVLPALLRLIAPAVASMGGGGSGAAAAGAAIGAGVAVSKVAAMGASGGASAGASGASAGGMSSIAGRGGGGPSGGISTASSPSPPPPSGGGGPGAQPALSGGQGGQASGGGSGGGSSGGGGPTSGLGDAMGSAGGLAGTAMQTVNDSVESEADSTSSDPSLSSPPPMRSGWNEHAMTH